MTQETKVHYMLWTRGEPSLRASRGRGEVDLNDVTATVAELMDADAVIAVEALPQDDRPGVWLRHTTLKDRFVGVTFTPALSLVGWSAE